MLNEQQFGKTGYSTDASGTPVIGNNHFFTKTVGNKVNTDASGTPIKSINSNNENNSDHDIRIESGVTTKAPLANRGAYGLHPNDPGYRLDRFLGAYHRAEYYSHLAKGGGAAYNPLDAAANVYRATAGNFAPTAQVGGNE